MSTFEREAPWKINPNLCLSSPKMNDYWISTFTNEIIGFGSQYILPVH